jgi:hypothetical protein
MNTIASIEKANYLATPDAVEQMAREQLQAAETQTRASATYFRVLLATTQEKLLGKPVLRVRLGSAGGDPDLVQQMRVFEEVNEALYAAVLRGVTTPDLEHQDSLSAQEKARRAKERNRRSTFARSAASTLRKYIRTGGDLRKVAVVSATKNGMTASLPASGAPAEGQAQRRARRAAATLLSVVEGLAADDRGQAAGLIRESMDRRAAAASRLAGRPTEKPATAAADHRMLKTSAGLFWPVTPGEVRVQ